MSMPASHDSPLHPVADFISRHEGLRTMLEWITDRLRDAPQPDTAIDWEDGEDHDEPHGPATL
jgi:hypothetical protein